MPTKSPPLRPLIFFTVFLVSLASCLLPPSISAQTHSDWYMAGANPQRTSWVSEEVRGNLNVEWYQPIEPYIPYNIQPVFYNDLAYIATSKGLYIFNLSTGFSGPNGRVGWVFPTELPYGNTPTLASVNNQVILFAPSLDRTIHAINTATRQSLAGYTPYIAGGGFSTSPLLIQDSYTNNQPVILAGNRDGYFYAFNALSGSLIWRYKTDDAILFSPAYKNGRVYFASNDLYAYALQVSDGTLAWKQGPFPTAGFFSYWPVMYTEKATGTDYVIFTNAENYRQNDGPCATCVDPEFIVPGCRNIGSIPCPTISTVIWPTSFAPADSTYFNPGTMIMDVGENPYGSPLTDYYEPDNFPHRRTTYILNAANGTEYQYDSDNDGKLEHAPFNWSNVTNSGSKYPGMVSQADGIYYNSMMYVALGWIPRGHPVGWRFGTSEVSRVSSTTHAVDEPVAYSGGGRMMYFALMGERNAGGVDITIPFGQTNRSWEYYSYSNLPVQKAPDYHLMYYMGDDDVYLNGEGWQMYAGKNQSRNGVYSKHMSSQSPPIPYKGKLYFLKGNALLAWVPGTPTRIKHPLAPTELPIISPSPANLPLTELLEGEIGKMLAAGHLRPGYFSSGFYDLYGQGNTARGYDREFGEIWDYFQNPAETVVTLTRALPHISSSLRTQTMNYLQTHYGPAGQYPFTSIMHVGWNTGVKRELTEIPPEALPRYNSFGARTTPRCNKDICGWGTFPPYNFYAGWKYAEALGGENPTQIARQILTALGYNSNTLTASKLETPAGFLADAFTVYVNGVAINTTSLNGLGLPVDDTAALLYLGGRAGNNFNGGIDEVKIFDRALTPAEVVVAGQNTCAQGSQNCVTPLAHWQFNEGSGTIVHNSSHVGSVLDGTLNTATSSAMWTTAGKYGGALHFDGLDDTVVISPHAAINLYGKQDHGHSVCGWIYPHHNGGGNAGEWFSKGTSYIRVSGYNGNLNTIRNSALFNLDKANASYAVVDPMPARTWNHVCVVWSNDTVMAKPYVLNQYIAGYLGFLELQKLAGYPENPAIRHTYDNLLSLRVSMFTKDSPFPQLSGYTSAYNYMDALSVARNFMYMTPELAGYLRTHAYEQFSEALNEYLYVAPYWFVNKFDATIGESTLHHLYDSPSLFQAKAYLMKESQAELVKYLDAPSFPRGDLFYLQNLVAAIEAPSDGTPTPTPPLSGDYDGDGDTDIFDVLQVIDHFGTYLNQEFISIFSYNQVLKNL